MTQRPTWDIWAERCHAAICVVFLVVGIVCVVKLMREIVWLHNFNTRVSP